jgi:collagen type VII alpha
MQCRTPGRGRWIVVLSLTMLCARAFADQATLVADAHVNAALPAVNSGAISNINVGGGYTGLLQFDLGMLPAGTTSAQVSRAVLRLYVNRVDAGGAINLQALNAAWSEYGVTYSTLPGMGTSAQTFNVSQAGAYVAVDVTTLVKGWISAPATNFGVALTAASAIAQFDSKENDLTGHAAALDIELTTQGAAGPAGPAGPQGIAGPQGAQGVAGPQGAQGLQGIQGVAGVAGPAGPAGAVGPAGPKGSTGFTYQGNYDPTVTYALADVVLSGGSSYLSLGAGNRGNSPASSPLTWGLLASGATGGTGGGSGGVAYQGVYSSGTNYALNDIVLYGASSYISLVAGNHGNTPASGSAYWGLLAVGGSGVVGPAGPAGPQGPQGQQGVPGLGFEGAYVSGTNYGLNDVVSFGGSSYISLTAGNHGNTPGLSPQSWAVLAAAGVGTVGATGATGATGPQGPSGPQGPQGAAGAQGIPGVAGAAGLPGLVYQGAYASTTNYALGDVVLWQGASWSSLVPGNHGNTPSLSPTYWGMLTAPGPAGTAGATGAAGPAGPTGPLGPVGPPGQTGAQGLQGIAGQAGAQGLTGPKGDAGLSGPMGPQGLQGPVGLAFKGTYSSSTNYALADGVMYGGSGYVSIIASNHGNTPDQSPGAWSLFAAAGSAGAAGQQGPIGLSGSTGPAGPQGPTGVSGAQGPVGPQGPAVANFVGYYASTTNYGVADAVSYKGSTYVSLTSGNHGNTPDASPTYWAVLVAEGQSGVQGPAGPAGAPGAVGPQGPAGPSGPQGVAGTAGAQGMQGPAGAQGLTGPTGATGDRGPQGLQGIAGQAGAQGLTGPRGDTGAGGPAGPQGLQGPVGLSFQGPYSATKNYGLGDGAMFGGSGYVSLIAGNHGNTPDQSPSAWALFAAAGTAGAAGATGPAGTPGATGPTGLQGPTGATGAQGLVGPQGPAVANFVGNYSSTTNYGVADAVSYKGSTYVSLVVANKGNTPDSSPSYWAVLVAEGQAGVQGPAGPAGTPGVVGPQGPAGANGAQGPPVTFAGGWLASHTYTLGDAVSYGGSSYIALNGNIGRQPDVSPNYWGVLAAVGSAGPAGATGATGLQGPTGYPGPAGATGATGAAGPIGPVGPAGATGPAGPTGAAGPQGVAGARGVTYRGAYDSTLGYAANDGVTFGGSTYISLTGANAGNTPAASPSFWGLLAAQGAAGAAGAAGANGKDGATGAQGLAGPAGPQGATGAAGANGAAGLVFQGAYSSAANYAVNDSVTYGGGSWISLAPANHGNAPDVSPSYWAALAKAGAAGVAGPAGPSGAVGATGPQGPAGAQGAMGATGAAGINFRGAWVAGIGYAATDAVTLGGTTYLAQMSNASVRPDANPSVWAVLAASGVAGPTGAAGAAATVQVGTVTTGAAGTSASITNSGTAGAAVLNFVIPQGVAGSGGSGGGTGGAPAVAMYHAVSYAATYYSVGNTNQAASETASVLTWIPAGCSATRLDVFSQQGATITVALRVGTPGAMADSALTCQVSTGKSCSATGMVSVPVGGFIDIGITHSDSNPVGVWTAVTCN